MVLKIFRSWVFENPLNFSATVAFLALGYLIKTKGGFEGLDQDRAHLFDLNISAEQFSHTYDTFSLNTTGYRAVEI